jgi:hypothetical protein
MFSGRDALEALGCCCLLSSAPVAVEPPVTLRGVEAGVQVGWLRSTFARQCRPGMSTLEVVQQIIKPATEGRKCRYVALLEPSVVGRARAFSSHTWKAPIHDLIAAIAHVLPDDAFVWVDIFAVLQWPVPEQALDLDFRSVVQACGALILVAVHVPEIAALTIPEAQAQGNVPEAAKQLCAFFRVWCLVEIAAALEAKLPVVMLVGSSTFIGATPAALPVPAAAPTVDDASAPYTLQFVPDPGMLNRLYWLIDITSAAATVEADRVRIIAEVAGSPGTEAVNSLARGAAAGAEIYMHEREVLAAVLGDGSPLAALEEPARSRALRCAAAGGLMRPLDVLLAAHGGAGLDLEVRPNKGRAMGGWVWRGGMLFPPPPLAPPALLTVLPFLARITPCPHRPHVSPPILMRKQSLRGHTASPFPRCARAGPIQPLTQPGPLLLVTVPGPSPTPGQRRGLRSPRADVGGVGRPSGSDGRSARRRLKSGRASRRPGQGHDLALVRRGRRALGRLQGAPRGGTGLSTRGQPHRRTHAKRSRGYS